MSSVWRIAVFVVAGCTPVDGDDFVSTTPDIVVEAAATPAPDPNLPLWQTASPTDDTGDGPGEPLLPPEAASILLTPEAPRTDDTLRVQILDEPDDSLSYNIQWYLNGTFWTQGVNQIAATDTQRGDIWRVDVRVTDGTLWSPLVSARTEVVNTPPVVFNLNTFPEIPRSTDSITVRFDCLDADNDSTNTTVQWFLDDVLWVTGNEQVVLPSSQTSTGDVWRLEVSCQDAEGASETAAVAFIAIL